MNSLCAADYLVVTLQSEYLALEGLGQIAGVVNQLRESGANPGLKLGGIVMTMYDNRTRLSYEVWQEVNSITPRKSSGPQFPARYALAKPRVLGRRSSNTIPTDKGPKPIWHSPRKCNPDFSLKTVPYDAHSEARAFLAKKKLKARTGTKEKLLNFQRRIGYDFKTQFF